MSRSKKAFINLSTHLLMQGVTAVCGFVVPKVMLETFGSEVNGLVSSISQFLGIIALMESGFGSVAKAALYKPIAEEDHNAISGVYNATESFFRKVAIVFLAYCVVLSLIFPLLAEHGFDYLYTTVLVLIMGINFFVQYFFGVSYTILLNADQRSYVSSALQIAVVILNAIFTVLMLNHKVSIHAVKLMSVCVFSAKPIVIYLYGTQKYRINRKYPKDLASVSQKWDNLGQSVALYIHSKVPIVYTTLFLNFKEVSVYSVYALITSSLSSLISSISTGFVSGLGNMYAKGERQAFDRVLSLYELVNTAASFVLFTVAYILMMPFVKLYTANLYDVDYLRPLFGTLLILSELIYCLRLPYYYVIINAGHFKQIRNGAYVEMCISLTFALCLGHLFGITGVAAAMVVASAFRTIQLVWYCSKEITKHSPKWAMKRVAVNLVGSLFIVCIFHFVSHKPDTFFSWLIYAMHCGVTALLIIGLVNYLLCREDFAVLFRTIKNGVGKKA